jgi:hypothetical protein
MEKFFFSLLSLFNYFRHSFIVYLDDNYLILLY